MSSRLVNSTRLGRARKISDSNIKEFNIVSNRPLVTFAKIQGSAREPYVVIIDLDHNTLAHSCPDFNRRMEWCKHIGKLLLMLETDEGNTDFGYLNQILAMKQRIRTENAQSRITSLLDSISSKQAETLESQDPQESSIEDILLFVAKQVAQGDKAKILDDHKQRILKLFTKDSSLLFLLSFENVGEMVPSKYRSHFDLYLAEILKQEFSDHFTRFKQENWTIRIITRLELAFMFNMISKKYKFNLPLTKFDIPKNLKEIELDYLSIILTILFDGYNEQLTKVLENKHVHKALENETKTLENIMMKLQFAGSHVDGLIRHIGNRAKSNASYQIRFQHKDHFLMYCIVTNQESPKFEFKFDYQRKISYIPKELVELPATKYAIYHIRESDRDYITQDEYHQHSTFFKFLNGDKVAINWIEKPRSEVHDHFLDTSGVIIQWDINVRNLFPEALVAMQDTTWLFPKRGSVLAEQLQPFDYTLNLPDFKYYRPFSDEVTPKHCITPRQVVYLVKQGVKIISNLLPWHVLQDYVHDGVVASGEVNQAIKVCEEHQFVYGSYELKSELKKLLKIGKQGPSTSTYQEIQKKLKVDSGRLNMRSREWSDILLTGEGKEFERLFHSVPKDVQRRHVINLVRKEKHLEAFRDKLYSEMIKEKFNRGKGLAEFLAAIAASYSHAATLARKCAHQHLRSQMLSLERSILDENVTRKHISDNFVGALITAELGMSKVGKMTDEDREKIENYYATLMDNFEIL